jgi:hypothetical protein
VQIAMRHVYGAVMEPNFKLVEDEIDKLQSSEAFKKSCLMNTNRWGVVPNGNLQSECIEKLKRATGESWHFLTNCELVIKPAHVLKVCSRYFTNRVTTVNRLHVVQTGTVKCGTKSFKITGREHFYRWQPEYLKGIKTQNFKPKSLYSTFSPVNPLHFSASVIQDSIPDDSSVVRVFNEQLAERLDQFDAEWKAAWDKALHDAEQIVSNFSGKNTSKEAGKFREKLREFLSETSGLLEVGPDTMLECMQIDPDDLQELVKFLRRNRSSLVFVCREDFEDSQKEAKVQQVMES